MKYPCHIFVVLIIGFLSLATWSCVDQKIDISDTTPYFTIQFINADSLNSLRDSISSINSNIKFIDDSLSTLDSLTANGDSTDYTLEKDTLNSLKISFNGRKNTINKIITVIKSGAVMLDKIIAIDPEGGIQNFSDTAKSYTLPLNPNSDVSQYNIFLNGKVFDLKAEYTRDTVVIHRKVKILANDFRIIQNDSYDSLDQVQTDSINFSSNDYTAIIYF